MKLSVIVPAFNLEQYIGTCLLSVLEQDTDFDFEVIVCDDCSTDDTANKIRVLESRYGRLKAIYKTQNQGLAANMHTLLERAKGEYVAYMDGDDLALPGKLQKQVAYLDSHADCHMVFHESDMFDSDTDKTIRLYSQAFYNWSLIPVRSGIEHMVRYGTYMQASSVVWRNHPGLPDTAPRECQIILDYPFYILNAGYLRANIDFIPEVLGRYRVHDNSFGAQTSRSLERRITCLEDIVKACRMAAKFGVDKSVIHAGISHHQFATALYFLQRKEDQLFNQYIELSASNETFFNDKHKLAWKHRKEPASLRSILAAG